MIGQVHPQGVFPVSNDLIGPAVRDITFGGRTVRVGPITMGQIHLLKNEFRKLPPPEVVAVDVHGLVGSLVQLREEDEEALKSIGGKINWVEEIKTSIRGVVLQAIREARGRQEQWPPDPISDLGITLIEHDERIQPAFVRIMLQKYQKDLTGEDARQLFEEADATEYQELLDAAFLTINQRNQKRLREEMERNVDALERLDDPKVVARMERMQKLQTLGINGSGGGL